MKRLNKKGFTLIELLAVIVIMGILMVVAIPAVSRTIENTRKDTFINTAKNYANQVKTLWAADGIECSSGGSYVPASAMTTGKYFVMIKSGTDDLLLEQGGKSPWKQEVEGYVLIDVSYNAALKKTVNKYYVAYTDGIHGIPTSKATVSGGTGVVLSDSLGRADITMTGMVKSGYAKSALTATGGALAGATECRVAD